MNYVILEKAKVKSFTRTRKGKLERVKQFERKGDSGIKIGKIYTSSELDSKGWRAEYSPGSGRNYIHKGKEMFQVELIKKVPKSGFGKVKINYKIIEGPTRW